MGSKKSNIKEDQDGPGPDQYSLKLMSGAPLCSFGGRFDSDVRSKDHIHPKKKDGPGPGSYVLPSGLKVYKPLTGGNAKRTTWGKAARRRGGNRSDCGLRGLRDPLAAPPGSIQRVKRRARRLGSCRIRGGRRG